MKIDYVKYLALGAGAVAVPAFIMGTGFAATLDKIPMWGTALYQAVTVGGIVLAGAGAALVDQLAYGK